MAGGREKRFKKIYIEITNACNLCCEFCPDSDREKRFMTLPEFRTILAKIRPFTDYLYFHVKGEPLLHPDLALFLEESRMQGYKVNITTNGTLINNCASVLLQSPALRQINFSLHSFYGNTPRGDLRAYIRPIACFAEQAIRQGIFVALRLWNLTPASDSSGGVDNRELLALLEEEFDCTTPLPVNGTSYKLKEFLYLNYDLRFTWPDLAGAELSEEGFCQALRTHAAILADGTVVPCCLDGEGVITLGNLHHAEFPAIINGERAHKLYEGFTRRKIVEPLCKTCGYRERFQ